VYDQGYSKALQIPTHDNNVLDFLVVAARTGAVLLVTAKDGPTRRLVRLDGI